MSVALPPTSQRRAPASVALTRSLGRFFIYLLLVIGSVIFMFPLLWMLSTALKPNWQVSQWPIQWIPHPFQFGNFIQSLTVLPFGGWAINSITITVLTVVGTLISCTMVAYGFARFPAPGRQFLFIVMLSTMMLPSTVTLIPQFFLFRQLHWINTFLPLIVPAFFGNAFFIFMLRQFFMTMPLELEEAARIDGLGTIGIMLRIIVPLSLPALATVAVFQFNGAWNDFMGPLIYLNKQNLYTLAVGINFFKSENNVQWNYLMAASTIFMLPSLLLFFFGQKYYVESITLTGIKG